MPSVRFRGFTTASTGAIAAAIAKPLYRFALDEHGGSLIFTLNPVAPPSGASFTISRPYTTSDANIVAPYASFFRAENITGFDVEEPVETTSVYDPTQAEITFVWTASGGTYTPLVTPNIPDAWRDYKTHYGRQIAHVFPDPGPATITCFAFDRSGNWATATYTFNDVDGDAPSIRDPDDPAGLFAGNKTICLSLSGNFTEAPAGASLQTTVSGVNSQISSRISGGSTFVRVLLRRGETYTDLDKFSVGGVAGIYYGAYGSDPNPPNVVVANAATAPQQFNNDLAFNVGYNVICDIDLNGPWDATKEIGRYADWTAGTGNGWYHGALTLVHRVRISGFNQALPLRPDGAGNNSRVFHDMSITNWSQYAAFMQATDPGFRCPVGIIGCDMRHGDDALTGINQGIQSQAPFELGNRHFFRWSNSTDTYIACTSFAPKAKWSSNSTTSYESVPPTEAPEAWRFGTSDGQQGLMNYHSFNRVHFECGAQLSQNGGGGTLLGMRNLVFDKILQTGTWLENSPFTTVFEGVVFRNFYAYFPNITAKTSTASSPNFFTFVAPGSAAAPNRAYNITILNARTDSNGGPTSIGALDVNQFAGSVIENVIVAAPNKSVPIGADLNLGTGNIPGVTIRHKGNRWNFCPIGGLTSRTGTNYAGPITVSSVREGGPGDVLNGEWVVFDYPDYTGICNGAGFLVTKALLEANSTQFHTVSVTDQSNFSRRQAMSPAAAGGNGYIVVDLNRNPGQISIQNTCGLTWGGSFNIWVLLDLSDYLMDHVPGTGAAGQGIPLPSLGTGSTAIDAAMGFVARDDFFGVVRGGQRKTDGTIASGSADSGALEVV